jgi:hypothetical protein
MSIILAAPIPLKETARCSSRRAGLALFQIALAIKNQWQYNVIEIKF